MRAKSILMHRRYGTLLCMAGNRAFEAQVAALDAMRQQPAETRAEPLRKGLGAKNNFIAAKAADLVRELHLSALTPDLLTAFDRFFENPEKSDPQCWAKNAISRALATFEYQEPDVFLRGMRHHQWEPVWGGRSDTAGTLRSTCAFALVQCRSVIEAELLTHLLELVADNDKAVRAEIVRAIEQVGSTSASLLLRMRALIGNDEPEVLGACYSGVLHLEAVRAIPWVSRFLLPADDTSAEAALAISATHSPEAFEALRSALENASDPWFRSVVLSAIALTRQESATEFLLEHVGKESMDAEAAIEALLRSAPSEEVVGRLEKLVKGNPRLERAFATQRSSQR
jgi:HEAT repeat protein